MGIDGGRAGVADVELGYGDDEQLDGFDVNGREAVRRTVLKLERLANPLVCAQLAKVAIFS